MPQTAEGAPPASVYVSGSWDVAFPLRRYSHGLTLTRTAMGYISLYEMKNQVEGIILSNLRARRERILTAIFEDTNLAGYDDFINPVQTIRRLANTDGALYPPIQGANVEAQDQHYREAAYTPATISAVNNPVITLRNEILEHFGGQMELGTDILYLCNIDQEAPLMAVAGFVAVEDMGINWGDATSLAKYKTGLPGRLFGRGWGCLLSVYDWIPATYAIAVKLSHPPLLKRVDTVESGLGTGLNLVSTEKDFPLTASYYEERMGYAVADRLSAAVIEISNEQGAEAYAPPAAYAE